MNSDRGSSNAPQEKPAVKAPFSPKNRRRAPNPGTADATKNPLESATPSVAAGIVREVTVKGQVENAVAKQSAAYLSSI